jgi:hypothetical protein
VNLAWALGRAIICAAVDAAVRHRQSGAAPGGQASGTGQLLLAAGLATLIVTGPGLLLGLALAGLGSGGP